MSEKSDMLERVKEAVGMGSKAEKRFKSCLFRQPQTGWRDCPGCKSGSTVQVREFPCFLFNREVTLTECEVCNENKTSMVAPFHSLDMSLSDRCNLRCPFCYICHADPTQLSKPNADRSLRIIRWFMEQAKRLPKQKNGKERQRKVSIFGGEPLLEYENLKHVVTEARREWEGTPLHFTIVTNATLLTEERMDWLESEKISFQMSIDGCPTVQDQQRVKANGEGTSDIIAPIAKMVIGRRPQTGIRATTTPRGARHLFETLRYFHEELGCTKVIPVHASGYIWTQQDLNVYEEQLYKCAEYLMQKLREGTYIYFFSINRGSRGFTSENWGSQKGCGAGHSMVCVDTKYNIWPCHRFHGMDPDSSMCLGNILTGGVTNRALYNALLSADCRSIRKEECKHCPAQMNCQGMCMWEQLTHGANGVCFAFPQGKNDHQCELNRIYFKVWQWMHTQMESSDLKTRELYRTKVLGKKKPQKGQNNQAKGKGRGQGNRSSQGNSGRSGGCSCKQGKSNDCG